MTVSNITFEIGGSSVAWRLGTHWHLGDVTVILHDDVIKWKHFPRYWPFVRGIHRSPVNSPHKGQWRGALMFSLICARINGWVNNREAGDLRRYRAHYDVIVMKSEIFKQDEYLIRSISLESLHKTSLIISYFFHAMAWCRQATSHCMNNIEQALWHQIASLGQRQLRSVGFSK